ncbi:hypothetical protein VE00_04628 [Pseudogymnoascus sp. WSF 3629]|nr:hypothetical protein VE00_04628 [Pseudogymnoascus sp. WSF 3629]
MKIISSLVSLSALSSVASAFPSVAGDSLLSADVIAKLAEGLRGVAQESHEKRFLVDPLTTPIDVTGDHSFIPPDFSAGDQRGPCPGLNALANHGYIGRNGVTNVIEATAAINKVFGMSVELGGLLAVMGTVFVGNPLSLDPGFSIGGESTAVSNLLGNLLGLLGKPRGLVGSHNIIESDSSNTRNDLYVTGDNANLELNQFSEWFNMSNDAVGDFNIDVMAERANVRFQQSKATNPNFYYGPFTGMIARNAGFIFPTRMFANYSKENLSGSFTKDIVKSFFAVEGEPGNFTYNQGWERIPENWYRIPVDYTLVQLNLDILYFVAKHPELGSIGGNTGTVDSFTGVDMGDLTGGLLNAQTLLEDNNLLCFVFEVLKTLSPNSLSTVFDIIEVPLQMLFDTLGAALLDLTCPAFKDLTVGGQSLGDAIESMFPGAAKGSI